VRFAKYVNEYSQKSKAVHYWHIILIIESILRRGPRIISEFVWFVRSNKLSSNLNQDTDKLDLPLIELLVVATEKDFDLLEPVILNALSSSINEVNKIKIVVPAIHLDSCREVLSNIRLPINLKVQIINEEDVLHLKIRDCIRSQSDGNYGWLLQQFIKLKLASESNACGILVVDADTFILGKNVWLDSSGKQKIFVAATRYRPYFDFLKDLNVVKIKPKYSFVVHHMLYQPNILRKLLEQMNCSTFEDFSEKVLRHKRFNQVSSLSIDYELYGQFLFKNFRELALLQRVSNLSLPREYLAQVMSEGHIEQSFSNNYNSISFHSWNLVNSH